MHTESTGEGGRARAAVAFGRRVAARTSDQDVTFLAAGVAYYGFVSLLPAAVLALVVAVTVGGQQLADALIAASAGVLTETGQAVLVDALVDGGGRGSATLVSLPLTLWGALKVFRGLDIAFSKVYGIDDTADIVDQLVDSVVVTASIGASLLAMVGLGAAVAALDVGGVAAVAGVLALPLVLTVAFLPMYYVFPDVPVSVPEILPGAVFAGVGWTVLQAAFQAYVGLQSGGDGGTALYGAVGAVLLLVTFLYFGATLVLVGAVVNAVAAEGRVGDADGGAGSDDPDGGDATGPGTVAGAGDDTDREADGRSTEETGRIKGRTRVRRDE
ncbi:YihY/virulence factor BrkB family protein [Halobaculum sp. CBA1158]|uniref:YihY/virulence factor BrkB family protein n=1 Tax=Halobaculum sp. CBA1158 TaxID=2904243 RepID=UPI002AA29C92|nr:YihY/virulence factor BrkB family protein [Halobaculum sp. CBA1158]